MITRTNHVITGPDLNRAGPLTLWGFLQDVSAKYWERPKKVLRFDRGAPSWYSVVQIFVEHWGG